MKRRRIYAVLESIYDAFCAFFYGLLFIILYVLLVLAAKAGALYL